MATYEALRQAIDTLIKANGNKEITGDILNNVLNTMLTALSANYQFCGEAKPNTAPGQPLQNVFYFAYEAGTYVNFGGITLPLGISMLKWDGTAWTGENIYTFDAQPLLNSSNLISSGAVYNALIELSDAMHSGKVFVGIADPSTTPDGLTNGQPIFYLAVEKGTYSHFFANGDIPLVLEKDGIWILTSGADDDDWNAVCLIEIDDTPNPLSKELISSKAVYNAIRLFGESFGFGKLYNGIATPTTTPDPLQGRRMFYFATQAGTYEHFFANGDIPLVLPHDGLYAIYSVTGSDDDDWNWEQILQFDDEVISNSHNLPTSMAVYNTLEAFKAEVNALIEDINPTVIEGNVTNAPDEEDLTSVNERLKFKDKEYNSLSASGLGRVYLRKNWVNGVNTLTQAMINEANTIYHIQYDYVLGEDITVPGNCVLEFDGGSISASGSNDTITGTNTSINAGLVKIFNTNITLDGNFTNLIGFAEWFGAVGDRITDDRVALQSAVDSIFPCIELQNSKYAIKSYNTDYYTNTGKKVGIIINKPITIKGKKTTDTIGGGNAYINTKSCIYEYAEGIDSTIIINSRSISLKDFAIKGNKVDEPNLIFTTDRHISTPFSNEYKSYINIENVECNYCTGEAFYILSYITQIKNCFANICGIGFFVGGNIDLSVPSGINVSGCPANIFEHNYVIGGRRGAYVFNGCGYGVINNCAADFCGFPRYKETAILENETYSVYKFYKCTRLTVNSCANEVASKALEIEGCNELVFNSCGFSGQSKKTEENTDWIRVKLIKNRSITFNCCDFESPTNNFINVIGDITYGNILKNNSIKFDFCNSYIGINSAAYPINNSSFKTPGIIPIIYNNGSSVVLNAYQELYEDNNINNNAANISPKTIIARMSLYSPIFKNHYGPLILWFKDANDETANATFYNNVLFENVNDLRIKGLRFNTSGANTEFVLRNSVVKVDSLTVEISNVIKLYDNSILVLRKSAVKNSGSVLNFICDSTSVIKVVDDNGNYYLSKDGLTDINSGTTKPTNPYIGQQFFDITSGIKKPIWWNGIDWVDATGTPV